VDRDGVLVHAVQHGDWVHGPLALDEFRMFAHIGEPIRKLRDAGFLIVLATNQPAIARGQLSWQTLNEMHRRLQEAVSFDAIKVCPHTDSDRCHCRKPKPGLLLDAASELNLDLAKSYFIGDTDRDVEAAKGAGVTPILIDAPYNQNLPVAMRVRNLAEAAEAILKKP
jgi:D-glycero-D-manno-heptose 1,7-bisphosphate phosphatase